eukprot:gnl/Hemi2/24191_TR8115_c1_g1_i1.p1 gnl/Hemi2/24191_TR8115_c1_g1~~gnl/Hemi2/24191_TR8115_c1_g1_i1.p1  ORF type:complete len:685 (-),score=181.65 gnl/Hemi2/24191_TR8115_c1_g1_i1:81-2135(-)
MFLAFVSSDFLCPCLEVISESLKMSQNVAGVTLLALGNGAPDLFSAYIALSNNSADIAFGSLFGAAVFVTSVVVGVMAIIDPVHITKRPFLRDMLAFLAAIVLVFSMLMVGSIYLWECILIISYYVLYVSAIVVAHYLVQYYRRRRRRRQARAQKAHDDLQQRRALDAQELPDVKNAGTASSRASVPPTSRATQSKQQVPLTQLTSHTLDDVSLGASHPIAKNAAKPFVTPMRRLDLDGATEEASGSVPLYFLTSSPRDNNLPQSPTYESFAQKQQQQQQTFLQVPQLQQSSQFPQRPPASNITITIDDDGSDDEAPDHNVQPLINPQLLGADEDDEADNFGTFIPKSMLITQLRAHGPSPRRRPSVNAPKPSRDSTNTKAILNERLLDPATIPDVFDPLRIEEQDDEPEPLPTTLYSLILGTPWSEKSKFDKFQDSIRVPMRAVAVLTIPDVRAESWCRLQRLLFSMYPVTSVLFFLFASDYISVMIGDAFPLAVLALLVGAVGSVAFYKLSNDETPPKTMVLFALGGFVVVIAWIYLTASELVSLLKFFGVVFRVPPTMLGLTVLAVGISLPDFFANINVAKAGSASMALSACIAGPLLNLLLGVGLSCLSISLKSNPAVLFASGAPGHTIVISICFLLLSLLCTLGYSIYNNWVLDKKYGIFLVCLYAGFMTTVTVFGTAV